MASTHQGVVIQWLAYKTATWEAFSEQWVLSQVRNSRAVLRACREGFDSTVCADTSGLRFIINLCLLSSRKQAFLEVACAF